MKILVVVDMQNDFIDGALGTKEAAAIVPYVKEVIENFEGRIIFTRDTHFENYMDTQEGKNLPVPHCIKGTEGWQICAELEALRTTEAIDKITKEDIKQAANFIFSHNPTTSILASPDTINSQMGYLSTLGNLEPVKMS